MTTTANSPPSDRYASHSTYGFWLEQPSELQGTNGDSIDRIVASEDYVALFLSPQQLSMDEPAATVVTFTQGGGKFVESRGGLIRSAAISGTTGFLPQQPGAARKWSGGLVDESAAAESDRAERSGFKAFFALRMLFRRFYDLRRDGVQVLMHWMDFKSDDFWQIEPQSFRMNRSARNPYIYEYDIRFLCLEPSGAPAVGSVEILSDPGSIVSLALEGTPFEGQIDASFDQSTVPISAPSGPLSFLGGAFSDQAPWRATAARYRDMIANGKAGIAISSGALQRSFQDVLSSMGFVVQAVDALRTGGDEISQIPFDLFGQLEDSVFGAFEAMGFLSTDQDRSVGILAEWNEFLLEVRVLNDLMSASSPAGWLPYSARAAATSSQIGQARALEGAATDLMPETGQPLQASPFLGAEGLDLVVDVKGLAASGGFRSVAVQAGETIWSFARRALGSIHRYADLVLANELSAPYVVVPGVTKPPGTVAWGEFLKVPIAAGASEVGTGPPGPSPAAFVGKVSVPGTSTQVIDSDAAPAWLTDQWVGYTVTLTSGAGLADPTRVVVANDASTLSLNRPWTASPTIGDGFRLDLQEFHRRVAPTDEQLAYGLDILLVWAPADGSYPNPFQAKAVLGADGDFATVSGNENFEQFIRVFFGTPRGEHPFHKTFGAPLPIGRPFSEAMAPLYTYFVKQGLLSDSRVADVSAQKLAFEGGALRYQASIRPINAHKSRQFDARFSA